MPTTKVSSDLEIYWEESGSGDPLVLIMGFALDARLWMFQVPAFAKQFRTISFDNRGAGRSGKPPGPYSTKQLADDTRGLLQEIGVASAHIVGISMGGMIAQELALNYPSLVKTLTLGCTYAKPDQLVKGHIEAIVGTLGGTVGENGQINIDASNVDPMLVVQSMMPLILSPSFLETNMNMLMEVLAGSLALGFSIEAIAAQGTAVASHDTVERLGSIKHPTLVITGTADLLIPPESSDKIAERIPGAKLVKVEGGSHGFNFEMPERFNREVLDFIATAK